MNRNLLTITHRFMRIGKFIEENYIHFFFTKNFVNISSKLCNFFHQEYVLAKNKDWIGVLSSYFRILSGENTNILHINLSPNFLSYKLFYEDLFVKKEKKFSKVAFERLWMLM